MPNSLPLLIVLTCACLTAQESERSPLSNSAQSHRSESHYHGQWTKLFDGKTLNGWTQRNGTADYRVEEGVIVARTKKGSPNSFLCSDRDYSDFELEFEVKVHNSLNSGVQIRSQTRNGFRGRVNGPQVEIEASGRGGAEAGYLYAEAAGGWMTPDDQRAPHKHFRDGEWNQYRVLAVGPRIQVWVNGIQVSDLSHKGMYKSHPCGFLGLQVHSIGNNQGPFEVRWRNLRLREVRSKAAGWKQLYNGKNLESWRTEGNWVSEKNGVLAILPREGELGWQRYGDYLWTKESYGDFMLDLEYKYTPGGNSGVFFRVGDPTNPVSTGIEAQILDSLGKQKGLTAHDHGGIIGTQAPASNPSRPAGEWNRMIICMRGSNLQVTLNGMRIIQTVLSETVLKDRPAVGFIGLQDHGRPHEVRFRKILVKKL